MKNKEKLGQEPAFPDPLRGVEQSISNQTPWANPAGMSKRFYAACAAMQGICADTNVKLDEAGCVTVAKMAYMVADELLKQENE